MTDFEAQLGVDEAIGRYIEDIRKARRRSRDALGHLSGVAPQTIADIERGRKRVTVETLGALAHGLGVGFADILDGAAIRPCPIARSGRPIEECEEKMARHFGMPARAIRDASIHLWGETLADRRNSLAAEDVNHADLGHVTRRLRGEIAEHLKLSYASVIRCPDGWWDGDGWTRSRDLAVVYATRSMASTEAQRLSQLFRRQDIAVESVAREVA